MELYCGRYTCLKNGGLRETADLWHYASPMHPLWEHLVEPLLQVAQSRTILEIGAEKGYTTEKLIGFAKEHEGVVHSIDPRPLFPAAQWEENHRPHFQFHEGLSLDVLPRLPACDAVIVDGDHNWHTVFHELKMIAEKATNAQKPPLILLHDIDWPYGRRDAYTDPSRIPEENRQPCRTGGVDPGKVGLRDIRLGINAEKEGGPKNGVRTAVEDFLKNDANQYVLRVVPYYFGLGILIPPHLLAPVDATLTRLLQSEDLLKDCETLRIAAVLEYQRLEHLLEHCEPQRAAAVLKCEQIEHRLERLSQAKNSLQKMLKTSESDALECKEKLLHILQTRSMRWTSALRRSLGFVRSVFRRSYETTMQLRTASDTEPRTLPAVPAGIGEVRAQADISVVIPCHNYGRFLDAAIESVLAQSVRPREIVVMDDASSDETADVAARYQERGVRYIRGEWRSVEDARNAGARCTASEFLCFLDADDMLTPNYLRKCLEAFHDPAVAVVYGDMWEFGDKARIFEAPQFDRAVLAINNYISSHAVLRRQVFDLVGGYRKLGNAHEDWDLYRRMTRFPWKAKKADTSVHHRKHGESYSHRSARSPQWTYPFRAAYSREPVTIFTPFAGRRQWFRIFEESIRGLRHDPALVSLQWYDTSGDEEFGQMLRAALSTMPFGRTAYTAAPHPEHWGHDASSLLEHRVENVRNAQYYYELAVVRAYNHLLANCDTELVLTLEDDVIPAQDALEHMLQTMDEDTVAVVAPYRCPRNGHFLVWRMDDKGQPDFPDIQETGVNEVAGSGFGCSLFRMSALKKFPIMTRVWENPPRWYDHIAFHNLRTQGEILCNWDIGVRHLSAEHWEQAEAEASRHTHACVMP